MKKIMIFILLLGLSGCGFVFQDFDQDQDKGLTYGMSKEAVLARAGQPQKISKAAINDKEYDVWEYADNRVKTSKVNPLGATYLKVFFLDGKLVQRNKDKVFGQPDYEYLESLDPQSAVKPVKAVESVKPVESAQPAAPVQPQENLK
jgi:hypothetical protein